MSSRSQVPGLVVIVCGNCDGASPEGSVTCAHCGRPLAVDPTPTQEMTLRGQPKQGRLEGADGVAVLTTRRLLLVGAREWDPALMDFPVDEHLTVEGWEREVAALVLQHHEQHAVIDGIVDRTAAHEMATRLRTAGAAGLDP